MNSLETPLVSIIVPTHNRPDLLQEALVSLQIQTYPAWEAVVVDNGPGLRVEHVVAQFDDPRMRYVYLVQGGEGPARNYGVSQARGDYLAFLDDDDRFLPQKLEHQVAYLQDNENIGLVGCGALLINHQGHATGEWPLWEYSPELTLDECIEGCFLMPTAVLIKRDWFERVGGQGNLVRAGDTDLFLRLMLAGCQMAWVKEYLCEYRVHSGSTQHDPESYAECREAMIEGILTDPVLPARIRARATNIRKSYALVGFAECCMAEKYTASRKHLNKALLLQPTLKLEDSPEIVESLIHAAGGRQVSDPFGALRKALSFLAEEIPVKRGVQRHALAQAARMSFYRAHKERYSFQIWRSFVVGTLYDPEWLTNRGTWSILLGTVFHRGSR